MKRLNLMALIWMVVQSCVFADVTTHYAYRAEVRCMDYLTTATAEERGVTLIANQLEAELLTPSMSTSQGEGMAAKKLMDLSAPKVDIKTPLTGDKRLTFRIYQTAEDARNTFRIRISRPNAEEAIELEGVLQRNATNEESENLDGLHQFIESKRGTLFLLARNPRVVPVGLAKLRPVGRKEPLSVADVIANLIRPYPLGKTPLKVSEESVKGFNKRLTSRFQQKTVVIELRWNMKNGLIVALNDRLTVNATVHPE